ncbi:putative mitochondrial protein [Cucumis melo var. makuwa]|uniref:Mitochondrial protein n=1 Tax=Cucumis melo var. makuwa TaxID=1194695 RepID=A0A5A7UAU0_CUCMM|nr:putative mitochondrial protein [Cucumis melo var. makuwa]
MEAMNRILRYLKLTLGSVTDRKPTSGCCTFVWGNLVTWRSKKQSVVTSSTADAEYRAMSLEICEEIWLQKVLSDLYQDCELPMKLFCDNKAAISIANNPVQHDITKHVEIDRHFIKEKLENDRKGSQRNFKPMSKSFDGGLKISHSFVEIYHTSSTAIKRAAEVHGNGFSHRCSCRSQLSPMV